MSVHDQLERSVAGAPEPDLFALAAAARADGTRRRRRRTAAAAVGALAVVTVLAGGVAAVVPGSSGSGEPATREVGVAASPGPAYASAIPGGDLVPSTARGAAAALAWSVTQESDGELTGFRGQIGAPYDPPGTAAPGARDLYGRLLLDDGTGASEVGVNVQYDGLPPDCDDPAIVRCTETPDGGGGTVYSSTEQVESGSGVRVREVTTWLRANGTAVSVGSVNGYDGDDGFVRTRVRPALDSEQLWEIARRGQIWNRTMPVSMVEAGETLPGYEAVDSDF